MRRERKKRKKYSVGMMVSNICTRESDCWSRYAESVVWTLCLGFTDKLQPTLHSFHSLLLSMNDL